MAQPTILVAGLGTGEIVLIVLALLLLFGGKKIPELMRGLGKGVKEFKDGKDGLDEGGNPTRTNENKPL
ncbi:Sec-independent protein translocase subunit TatA/TatB [Pedobacter boryungensis]|uniref:Sec-independent protein translocase protein TatA n=1 Tax=Pedobacter boryungensis TaxID=869962 RepID=A0ABX2DFI5_9SPHI|nr:twin-arginine translocase TatA/TatE family subunit [Pedobacter boryungensis]NQX32700.1 twin-arginine translocase TatA/TatE family subunit [Pedobacter boryungensis]